MFRGKVEHIHFIGIGGAGMCGIAEVLLSMDTKSRFGPIRRKTHSGLRAKGGSSTLSGAEFIEGVDVWSARRPFQTTMLR